MKHQTATTLSIAAVSLGLAFPQLIVARETVNPQSGDNSTSMSSQAGMTEANQMVPAQAALDEAIDARKATPGEQFEATLAAKVHLKNGAVLPTGTKLVGQVAKDDMQMTGSSKLALCFTQAKLKNGTVMPIKATIVGIYGPNSGSAEPYPTTPGDQVPTSWNDQTLQVDQIGAMSGVDLHSRVASNNSGVLTSTRKDDIKLGAGTEFGLAIAPGSGQPAAGSSGS